MKESMLFYSLVSDIDTNLCLWDGLGLPLAFTSANENGLYDCWRCECADLWLDIKLTRTPAKGFWIYEIEYDDAQINDAINEWGWLTCGTLKLATADDMRSFHRKDRPWIVYP